MNPTKVSNINGQNMALYALIAINFAILFYYIENAIHAQASLIYFWLPVFALFLFYCYSGVDEYKKLNDQPIVRERTSLKSGLITLVLLIFLLATKNWKTSQLGISDAFIYALLLSNNKDYILNVLLMRQSACTPAEK